MVMRSNFLRLGMAEREPEVSSEFYHDFSGRLLTQVRDLGKRQLLTA
jgi:hypothetical protein